MDNETRLGRRLVPGRKFRIEDQQQPFELIYAGTIQALTFRFVDWYSKDFSDPYLRIRPDSTETLRKFRPLDGSERPTGLGADPPRFFPGEKFHVPSGLGGVFTVEFIGRTVAHLFTHLNSKIVLSEARALKAAENPLSLEREIYEDELCVDCISCKATRGMERSCDHAQPADGTWPGVSGQSEDEDALNADESRIYACAYYVSIEEMPIRG